MIKKYGAEQLRWYLLRESHFGDTLAFSERSLANRYNTELADEFLNLINRSWVIICQHLTLFNI